MVSAGLLAALTVTSTDAPGCPDQEMLVERLGSLGVSLRPEDDIQVRFSLEDGKRVATIATPGATSRRIEHEGLDCSSLGDATVALLSVLLYERSEPRPARAPTGKPPEEQPAPSHPPLRAEAGILVSHGIVAPLAAGVSVGVAWRPVRWGALGLTAEAWPARDHPVGEGTITVGASSIALTTCAGPRGSGLSVEVCFLGHTGIYTLSAEGFPVVRPEQRVLWAAEIDLRAAVALTKRIGLFVRAGAWAPLTRLDVTARGADTGFSTTSFGPKGTLGLELNR